MTFRKDSRQSTEYRFHDITKGNEVYSSKIKPNDPRSSHLYDLNKKDIRKSQVKTVNQSANVESKSTTKQVEFSERSQREADFSDRVDHRSLSFNKLNDESKSSMSKVDLNKSNQVLDEKLNDNQSNYIDKMSTFGDNKDLDLHAKLGLKRFKNRHKKCICNHYYVRHKRYIYHLKSRPKRFLYNRLMKQYLRNCSPESSESKLTNVTSPIMSESPTAHKASKSLNVDDNTLDSIDSS